MNTLRLPRQPSVATLYRLQFESAQNAWVLLYPEGMVRLNGPAGEILRLCDGQSGLDEIVNQLEQTYGRPDLWPEICHFLEDAHARGWIV